MNTVALVPKLKSVDGKIRWWNGHPAIKQPFPFHDTLIYYISMNPSSPKVYNKLIKCCKYFFEANPILVTSYLFVPIYGEDSESINGEIGICSNQNHKTKNHADFCCIAVDLRKMYSKIWLTEYLNIREYSNSFLLCRKLYRCEITRLTLFSTTISFDDLKFLVQNVEKLCLQRDVKITYNDEKSVSLDEILEVCPKIEYFYFNMEDAADCSNLKNISNLQNLSNLKHFEIFCVPEIFSIQDVSDFLSKEFLNTKIIFCFDVRASEEYKFQLGAFNKMLRELQIQNHSISFNHYDFEEELFDEE